MVEAEMSNIKSLDYIVTAKHYGGSARGYIRRMQRDMHKAKGIAVTIKDIDAEPTGIPVSARIWQGQWIADCECRSASFVDPDEPVFFCFGCGNRANGQKPRPVIFPPEAERKEIERLLLERPVDDMAGLTDLERAGMAKPILYTQVEETIIPETLDLTAKPDEIPVLPTVTRTLPLTRSWEPGETIADLHAQQAEPIRMWKKGLRNG
jgi:hypothetical protein